MMDEGVIHEREIEDLKPKIRKAKEECHAQYEVVSKLRITVAERNAKFCVERSRVKMLGFVIVAF